MDLQISVAHELQKGVFQSGLSMRRIVFAVPMKEFLSLVCTIHILTQMGTRLEQNKGSVSGKINGISSVSIVPAAVIDFCVPVIKAIR